MPGEFDYKRLLGGFLVQTRDALPEQSFTPRVVTQRHPVDDRRARLRERGVERADVGDTGRGPGLVDAARLVGDRTRRQQQRPGTDEREVLLRTP